jgi:hypothetical protein
MGVGGSVWWALTSVVSSLIHLELSYILLWRPSISLSLRLPLLELFPPLSLYREREREKKKGENDPSLKKYHLSTRRSYKIAGKINLLPTL